jgi:hypothetical protein
MAGRDVFSSLDRSLIGTTGIVKKLANGCCANKSILKMPCHLFWVFTGRMMYDCEEIL